jgi:hypothetical protein
MRFGHAPTIPKSEGGNLPLLGLRYGLGAGPEILVSEDAPGRGEKVAEAFSAQASFTATHQGLGQHRDWHQQ